MSAEQWLARAHRSLSSANLLLKDGDQNGAVSTAYYAMFYAAKSALIYVGQPERAGGKTHSGLVSAFHQFLVRTTLVAAEHGEAFTSEFHRRLIADYAIGDLEEGASEESIFRATSFVSAVEIVVRSN